MDPHLEKAHEKALNFQNLLITHAHFEDKRHICGRKHLEILGGYSTKAMLEC